jgi:hypothetical protein
LSFNDCGASQHSNVGTLLSIFGSAVAFLELFALSEAEPALLPAYVFNCSTKKYKSHLQFG